MAKVPKPIPGRGLPAESMPGERCFVLDAGGLCLRYVPCSLAASLPTPLPPRPAGFAPGPLQPTRILPRARAWGMLELLQLPQSLHLQPTPRDILLPSPHLASPPGTALQPLDLREGVSPLPALPALANPKQNLAALSRTAPGPGWEQRCALLGPEGTGAGGDRRPRCWVSTEPG